MLRLSNCHLLRLTRRNADELAPWGATRHKIGPKYIKQYLKYMPASEPTEDFDDRVLLYEMYVISLRRQSYGDGIEEKETTHNILLS
jgi:hypothetical protein